MNTQPDYTTMTEAEIADRFRPRPFANFEEALAWIHSQNPNMAENHPEDLDWQAIKAEGRRY